jgi:hypothetical protein
MNAICEKCGLNIEVKYGSGRFCSKVCARSFSTSLKRKEISKKVSDTLKVKLAPLIDPDSTISLNCIVCKEGFEVLQKNKKRKCCSEKCIKNLLSMKACERNEQGNFFQSFGRRVVYEWRDQQIRCDSLIEWCALEHLVQTYNQDIISIKRSSIRIPYKMSGSDEERYYNPDFEIAFSNGSKMVVECKSEQSGTTEIWKRYHGEAKVKKKVFEDYCKSNNAMPLWFTQKTRKDLYRLLVRKKML